MVLNREVEPPEKEELRQPILDLVSSEELVGGRHAAVFDHHLEEAGRSVPEPGGRVVDVHHRRVEPALQVLDLAHAALHVAFRVRRGSDWVAPFRHYLLIVTGLGDYEASVQLSRQIHEQAFYTL